ncbi:hypothetical protein, partial [Mycobacterium tuberculosis]|uniref:hypothetical protein n=1 Tax=Mycobacterium tuberculosis TaxID=1773 RepID=UPI00131F3120
MEIESEFPNKKKEPQKEEKEEEKDNPAQGINDISIGETLTAHETDKWKLRDLKGSNPTDIQTIEEDFRLNKVRP